MAAEKIISADSMYTVADLLSRGIGRETLSEARRSGIARPVMLGKQHRYFGSEIIAYAKHIRTLEDNAPRA